MKSHLRYARDDRSFFRELDTEEIITVAKNASDKVGITISEKGLQSISDYARNGREAVNMIQTLAGISINENRTFIREEDIDWMAHSSQLTQRMDRKIESNSKIGLVNGLAVYGPNSGALLEIEVMVMAAPDEKGSINITGIVEEESIGGGMANRFAAKAWQKVRLKM